MHAPLLLAEIHDTLVNRRAVIPHCNRMFAPVNTALKLRSDVEEFVTSAGRWMGRYPARPEPEAD